MLSISRLFLALLAITAATSGGAILAQVNDGNGTNNAHVYVVHGIPGPDVGPVDVSANGNCIVSGLKPCKIAGPLWVPPGTYDIAISQANADNPCSNPALLTTQVNLLPGSHQSIVAHLTAGDMPTTAVYPEDVSPIQPGKTRVNVRHTAAAPAVDVVLERLILRNRDPIKIENLWNPNESGPTEVYSRAYRVKVLPAGSDQAVLGPQQVVLLPRRLCTYYAVGSLQGGTLKLLRQETRLHLDTGQLHLHVDNAVANLEETRNQLKSALSSLRNNVRGSLNDSFNNLDNSLQQVEDNLRTSTNKAFTDAQSQLTKYEQMLNQAQPNNQNQNLLTRGQNRLNDAQSKLSNLQSDVNEQIGKVRRSLTDAQNNLNSAQQNADEALPKAQPQARSSVNGALSGARGQLNNLNNGLKDARNNFNSRIESLRNRLNGVAWRQAR